VSKPAFLDKLDSHPNEAYADFHLFAVRQLRGVPPTPLRTLFSNDRDEVESDIIYHCIKDDFRVLRTYVDEGKPFEAWLYEVARRKTLDWIKAKNRRRSTFVSEGDQNDDGLSVDPQADSTPLDLVDHLADILHLVAKQFPLLGKHCQLLLQLAADEYTPKEMVEVLRLPKDQNKKISDDLRYCRNKLKDLMFEQGVDLSGLIAPKPKGRTQL
jgi:DNA-directed RNA polymerase specialized sigma24 family protein